MKIGQKLILGFSAVVLLVGVVGSTCLLQLRRIAEPLNTDIPESERKIHETSHLDGLAQFIRYYDEVLTQSARNFAFTQEQKWEQRYRDVEPKLDKIIKEAIEKGDEKDKEFFSSVDKANLALVEMEYAAIELVNNGRSQEAVKILESNKYWNEKKIYKQGLISYVHRRGAQYDEALSASTETIRLATTRSQSLIKIGTLVVSTCVIIALILSAGTGFIIFRSISKPISSLKVAASEIGKGKLDTQIDIQSSDELGELADSFRKMTEDLKETTTSINNLEKEITERKKAEQRRMELEEKLRHAQKMEAIGTLAGGIAHDFNNILGALVGYVDMSLEDTPAGTVTRNNLEHALSCCTRARGLVKQILTFGRGSEQERKLMQISPVVEETLQLLRSSLPTTIEVRQNIDAISSMAVADSTQIHQVLVNLCTNAAHAMENDGGVLEVSLVDIGLESDVTIDNERLKQGSYLRLSVSDTGHGMDGSVMKRIFEPFFTTKAVGKGTGMGLSVVHGIVEDHGGTITVKSTPGKGTTFNVFLPRIESGKQEQPESSVSSIPRGNETILLIDDEVPIIDATKQMLERLGYTVVGEMSGIDALETFRAEPGRFDLIITDQTMPTMSGLQLAEELMNIRPEIPIILCTGFSEGIGPTEVKSMGIREFVMKPVIKKDIAVTIRNILDKKEIHA